MLLSVLVDRLQHILDKRGDMEVYVRSEGDPDIDTGYVSITGQVFSEYDFKHFPKDYPERAEFDLKKDLTCLI